jgi:hypothetical protein
MIVVAPADGGYQKIAVSVSGGACHASRIKG